MRLVSLVPSITEALAQLGAGDQLIGVTDYCLYPHEVVERTTKVGGTKNPHIQQIRDLEPDLVIANSDEQRTATLDELADAGLDLLVTETDSLAEVAETWTQLGSATDTKDAAARERQRLEDAIDAARQHTKDAPRLATLIPVWRNPWMATGGGTYVGDLLATCGFDNVFATLPDKWVRFEPTTDSDEAASHETTKGGHAGQKVHALPRVPDVVLLPTEPYAFTDPDRERFATLGIDREQVHIVDGELLTWWLSKSVQALDTFTALHDELAAVTSAS